MKKPDEADFLPLEYAAQIAFELDSMRGECSQFAAQLLNRRPLDEHGLEECARLDEALARAHTVLRHTLDAIQAGRGNRTRKRH